MRVLVPVFCVFNSLESLSSGVFAHVRGVAFQLACMHVAIGQRIRRVYACQA